MATKMAEEFEAFETAVRAAGMRLATTPARICGAEGARFGTNISLTLADGTPDEQFYKWQLVSALINTGRIPADHIGTELAVPRGSLASSSLHVDVVIFSDPSWRDIYDSLKANEKRHEWSDLYALVIGCFEIKADPRDDMERTIGRQLLPALNTAPGNYTLGAYYNSGHAVLLARSTDAEGTAIARLDPTRKGTSGPVVSRLNASVPDGWEMFPKLEMIKRRGAEASGASREGRNVADLDVISSRSKGPIDAALAQITRVLDSTGMRDEIGYHAVVESIAAKVWDEARNEREGTSLSFYIDAEEMPDINGRIEGDVAVFRDRIKALHEAARPDHPVILHDSPISWNNAAHLKVIAEVVRGFQDISLRHSEQSDLYQLVFYNFAGELSKIQQAQFTTPLPVIDFLVEIINPKPGELLLDPTSGIADFLAVPYTRGRRAGLELDAEHLYGIDNDQNMMMLAALNMLLNGDGAAKLFTIPDTGSLDHKLVRDARSGGVVSERLTVENAGGSWDPPAGSGREPMKFDVVMTNPPFGDGRALKLDTAENRAIASLYEVAEPMGNNQIDKGLLFLENAFRVLDTPGRLGIVLSSAIANVAEYAPARDWLFDNARVVAVFDLPPNIFAETGVPTTLIVAYKVAPDRLEELKGQPYEIFDYAIERVGFTKVTRARTTLLVDRHQVDPTTGRVKHDPATGAPILDEEFTEIVEDFRQWARTQESELQRLFLP